MLFATGSSHVSVCCEFEGASSLILESQCWEKEIEMSSPKPYPMLHAAIVIHDDS